MSKGFGNQQKTRKFYVEYVGLDDQGNETELEARRFAVALKSPSECDRLSTGRISPHTQATKDAIKWADLVMKSEIAPRYPYPELQGFLFQGKGNGQCVARFTSRPGKGDFSIPICEQAAKRGETQLSPERQAEILGTAKLGMIKRF